MRAMIEFCTEAASMCRNYMPQHAIVCVFKDVGARRVMMFWFMLCWGQCLGTNKCMQGHHETQRQMLVVVQYDGSSLTRRVRMPECSQGCYSPISCLRGLMHFVLFSVSGRGCIGMFAIVMSDSQANSHSAARTFRIMCIGFAAAIQAYC